MALTVDQKRKDGTFVAAEVTFAFLYDGTGKANGHVSQGCDRA